LSDTFPVCNAIKQVGRLLPKIGSQTCFLSSPFYVKHHTFPHSLVACPEDGGNSFLWCISICLWMYTAPSPKM